MLKYAIPMVLSIFTSLVSACVDHTLADEQVGIEAMKMRLDSLIDQNGQNEGYETIRSVLDELVEMPEVDSSFPVPTVNPRGGGGRCWGETEVFYQGKGQWAIYHYLCCSWQTVCTVDAISYVCLSDLCED